MSFGAEGLYQLLPAFYRAKDAQHGYPLKALLGVINEQVAIIEEDIAQLYDDQFIETCAEWVAPYIGDLVGARGLHARTPKTVSQRAQVANTLAYRRRKGTATVLERLANDVTGWRSRAVEFFQLLATTQYMNHIRPHHNYAPDLRQWEPLERLNTAFDTVAHTVDVRHIADGQGQGRYNIPNIGIFLWRLRDFALTLSPASKADENDDHRFLFSPLGNDTQLFTFPEAESDIAHLAEPWNVPAPISRWALEAHLERYYDDKNDKNEKGYGEGKSIFIEGVALDPKRVHACDLSDAESGAWAHQPEPGHVAIDPALGRIAFGDRQSQTPRVSFRYGFSAPMGGGEYDRAATFATTEGALLLKVGTRESFKSVADAVAEWEAAHKPNAVIEIQDSGTYKETIASPLIIPEERQLQIRAANETRPTVLLSSDLLVSGEAHSSFEASGLLIANKPVRAKGDLSRFAFTHCTLVPGRKLKRDGSPAHPSQPSLYVEAPHAHVRVDHCILGGICAHAEASVQLADSIVDANSPDEPAYASVNGSGGGPPLSILRCTVIGKVFTREMVLGENCIFLGVVTTERRQKGCVRFSYVPPRSQTPRRFRCQPDFEILKRIEQAGGSSLDANQRKAIRESVEAWLVPSFTTLHYGKPPYAQLGTTCPTQISRGADDEAEMGAFHDLYQPQKEANLRLSLDEYLRFGLEAGVFYAT